MSEGNTTQWRAKPCPFCGVTDIHPNRDTPDWVGMQCGNCGAIGPQGGNVGQASLEWNRRMGDAPTKTEDGKTTARPYTIAEIDRMRRAIDWGIIPRCQPYYAAEKNAQVED